MKKQEKKKEKLLKEMREIRMKMIEQQLEERKQMELPKKKYRRRMLNRCSRCNKIKKKGGMSRRTIDEPKYTFQEGGRSMSAKQITRGIRSIEMYEHEHSFKRKNKSPKRSDSIKKGQGYSSGGNYESDNSTGNYALE